MTRKPLKFFLLLCIAHLTALADGATEKLSLNEGWKFHQGDIPFPVISGHGPSYRNAKAGTAWGAAAPDYDDSSWQSVRIPHDWAVTQPVNSKANLSQGYRDRGFGWYRRAFHLGKEDRGKALELLFDGVSTHCQVWLNGTLVHRNWCGYTGFSIDLTPFALYGDESNQLVVRVDAQAMEGWWYEGAGIYRHTWLIKREPQHIVTDGVFAHPVRDASGEWSLPIEVTAANITGKETPLEVEVELIDPKGNSVGKSSARSVAGPINRTVLRTQIAVKQPQLWSIDAPTLYSVRSRLLQGGREVDCVETRCGFRTIRFDVKQGFFLNEKPVKIKGTCNHQDHAGVGVAVPDSIWEYRVRRLKELGSNAYRVAHNPPSREFLEICDRLGMLVMDENRNFNVSPEFMSQLEWLIRRDRNHPSVILWSVFNEETTQGTEMGFEMVRRMVAAVKRLDPTRPVTAAMSGGHRSPINVSQAVDVVGFNYNQNVYDEFHAKNPDKPITSSEDTSAFSVRGCHKTDPSKNLIDNYDTQRAPWGLTHRQAWRRISERPFVAGGFVWTGFDYRGEPTPHQWPSVSSFFGIMDLCGFPKAAYYLHQAHWISDRPVIHIVPHWNAPADPGKPVQVMVITNGDQVELSLNGKSIGSKSVDPIDMVEFEVPYQPGALKAVVTRKGAAWTSQLLETTGPAVALRISPDRPTMSGTGRDAIPVTVDAVDAQGRHVPTANLMVSFATEGPGRIIGVGNGDPNSHEPEQEPRRSLFNGLAQVILESGSQPGTLLLKATADGLKPAEIQIQIDAAQPIALVPTVLGSVPVRGWKMSPVTKSEPDPMLVVSDQDMNTWSDIQPGTAQDFGSGGWALLRTKLTLPGTLVKSGGSLEFRNLRGKVECYIDGKSIGKFEHAKGGKWRVKLAPGNQERQITLRIHAPKGKAGLLDMVVFEDR